MKIIQMPSFYVCPSCHEQVSLMKVRKSDTLPLETIPTLDDVDTFVEIQCCSKCGRDVYPVFTDDKRILFPGSKVKLEFDAQQEHYIARKL